MDAIKAYKDTRQKLFDSAGVQPESIMVTTKGLAKNVHYLKIGQGKPLILIHGGGSHSSEWINILKPLAEQFQLYVVDRPGCGLSDAFDYRGVVMQESAVDFVRSFMDAVGLQQASFLGQSMGGYFSICFALQYPERVERLLLIGAPAGMNRWIPLPLRLLGASGLNKLLIKTVAKPSVKNLKNLHQQILVADMTNISDDYLLHGYYSQLLPGNAASFLSLLENVLTISGWKKDLYIGGQLHQLQVPVRFIWGDQDAFEKPESGLPKASAIPDYQFEVVENAGHGPWLDQPERCVHLIFSMLK
ncbi:MAG: alpha/beta hydrolase [Cyclobacteriaceae bacterium]